MSGLKEEKKSDSREKVTLVLYEAMRYKSDGEGEKNINPTEF